MPRQHGTLALVTIAALVVSSIGVYVYLAYSHLPAPVDCSRQQLFHWLALHDLDDEPLETQDQLVDRLQEEILLGITVPETTGLTDSTIASQLSRNTELLKQRWFNTRCLSYSGLPPEKQNKFLDRQIETIEKWVELDAQVARLATSENDSESTNPPEASNKISDFFDDVEQWLREASEGRRQELKKAVEAGMLRWLCTSPLEKQSLDTRTELAGRISHRLENGLELPNLDDQAPSEQTTLQCNCELLAQAWFYDQAEQYQQLTTAEQPEFIESRIVTIKSWNLTSLFSVGDSNRNWLQELQLLIAEAVHKAPDDLRPLVEKLKNDAQMYLLTRSMRSLFPTK